MEPRSAAKACAGSAASEFNGAGRPRLYLARVNKYRIQQLEQGGIEARASGLAEAREGAFGTKQGVSGGVGHSHVGVGESLRVHQLSLRADIGPSDYRTALIGVILEKFQIRRRNRSRRLYEHSDLLLPPGGPCPNRHDQDAKDDP